MSGIIISPSVKFLYDTVRAIRKRIEEPGIRTLTFPEIYQKMSEEFPTFADQQPRMFVRLIETTKPETSEAQKKTIIDNIVSVLYYRDRVVRGLMTEEEVADIVAGKYLTPELKAESDRRLKAMREAAQKKARGESECLEEATPSASAEGCSSVKRVGGDSQAICDTSSSLE